MVTQDSVKQNSGFTIIEMLMVILLVSILAVVAIPQFLDFRAEAKDAATQASLGAIRTGIANQKGNIILRCNAAPGRWPAAASLTANSVITGGDCTAVQLPNVDQARVVASPSLPGNPWGATKSNAVTACTGGGCTKSAGTNCAGAAYTAAADGWCYDPNTGDVWANSANSTSAVKEWTF